MVPIFFLSLNLFSCFNWSTFFPID